MSRPNTQMPLFSCAYFRTCAHTHFVPRTMHAGQNKRTAATLNGIPRLQTYTDRSPHVPHSPPQSACTYLAGGAESERTAFTAAVQKNYYVCVILQRMYHQCYCAHDTHRSATKSGGLQYRTSHSPSGEWSWTEHLIVPSYHG